MKETYKGLASGIIYASKGDKVNVIRVEDNLTFVEFNGEKFHVQTNILSDKSIEADKEITDPPVISQPASSVKKKVSKPIIKQSTLF